MLLLELLTDSGHIVQSRRGGGLGAHRQVPVIAGRDESNQCVPVPVPRALKVVPVYITIMHAVSAAKTELSVLKFEFLNTSVKIIRAHTNF